MRKYIETFKMGRIEKRPANRDPFPIIVTYESADQFLADYERNLRGSATRIASSRMIEPGTVVDIRLTFRQLTAPILLDAIVQSSGEGAITVQLLATSHEKLHSLAAQVKNRDPRLVAKAINVLVVDDNPHVLELMQQGLTRSVRQELRDYVFAFDAADNGAEALDLLQARAFDIAIVDVYLPVLDGPSMIQRVRTSLGLTMPIISMSAGGHEAQKAAMSAGASVFLDKPVRMKEIAATMRELLAA
jgi:CheY-like chemotaxis protein